MGIKTIEFALPVRNIKNKTKMLSLEGGTTSLTITPGRKLKLNSYLTTDAHNIMVVSILEFISEIPGQSEEYMMPVFQSQTGRV